jgi:hypothetical protein
VPKLRFRKSQLESLSRRYEYNSAEIDLFQFKSAIQKHGYLTKDDLRQVALWKSRRSARWMESNSDEFIKEITRIALTSKSERVRIESLILLDGVKWPTASVILHFFHKEKYPILDFRALWSLSEDVPNQYKFDFWWQYTLYCRSLANEQKISMRALDQALWQYSKENQ